MAIKSDLRLCICELYLIYMEHPTGTLHAVVCHAQRTKSRYDHRRVDITSVDSRAEPAFVEVEVRCAMFGVKVKKYLDGLGPPRFNGRVDGISKTRVIFLTSLEIHFSLKLVKEKLQNRNSPTGC